MLALHEFQSITIQLSFLHVTYYVGVALELLQKIQTVCIVWTVEKKVLAENKEKGPNQQINK